MSVYIPDIIDCTKKLKQMQKQNNSTMRYHSLLRGKRAIIKKMKK